MYDDLIPRPFWAGGIKKRKMKNNLLYLMILLLNFLPVYSQEIINIPAIETNETIHQISTPGINDIMNFQTLNQRIGNFTDTQQIGNQNKLTIHQQVDPGLGFSNQSYSIQEGNSNEMTVGQIGSGNILLSFQLGYLSNSISESNLFRFGLENSLGTTGPSNERNAILSFGKRNILQVTQEGSNNRIMASQQGTGNYISAGQKGDNSYLAILQKGMNNSVSGYMEENTDGSILFETITQVGENLSLSATDVSRSKLNGNVFNQSGVNLSLEVNNGLINTLGGIEINQTGRDMKVVVGQSYFSFPMQ